MKYFIAILILLALCTLGNNVSTGLMEYKQISERLSEQELDEIRMFAEQFPLEDLDIVVVHPQKLSLLVQKAINSPFSLMKLERFAMEAPVIPNGLAPEPLPEQINRILIEFREQGRTDHLPYFLEYGLNLYLKNLTLSQLARVLPVNENLMLSELVRLAKIPKYKTFHEAGWLNRQFIKSGDITERPYSETGYSSYQIYIWYLENWSSVLDMPNIDRLCDIQKQIEKTGMHGVGGGKVCHYGCR